MVIINPPSEIGAPIIIAVISLIGSFLAIYAQYENSKKYKNYGLYIDKKHAAYQKLWKLLILAVSAVKGQRGLKQYPEFESLNKDDIVDYLSKIGVGSKDIQDWVNLCSTASKVNRKKLNSDWTTYLGKLDIFKANPTINKLNNSLVLNQIYLDESLENDISMSIKLLREVAVTREYPANDPKEMSKDRSEVNKNLELVDKLCDNILKEMQKELTGENKDYNILRHIFNTKT